MPYYPEKNILFIHIPKTGGRNVEKNLKSKYKEELYGGLCKNVPSPYNKITPQHQLYTTLYKYKDKLNINFKDLKIFTIVRNPYDRIMSDLFYLSLINHNSTKDDVYNIIKHDYLYKTRDNHTLEQYKFITNENSELIPNIKIFKTENFNEINKELNEYLDVDINIEKKNVNKDYTKYLNNESIYLINKIYKKDFELFNYNFKEPIYNKNNLKICFVKSLFGNSYSEVDKITNVEKISDCDYYLFTNLDVNNFKHLNWNVINIDYLFKDTNIKSNIIKSRYAKFMAWKIFKNNLKKNYDIIYYCDAYLNPGFTIKWDLISETIINSNSGIAQKNHLNNAYRECDFIVECRKDNKTRTIKTKQFLKKNNHPKNKIIKANTYFGYTPHNKKLTDMCEDFWNEYSTYNTSHRDQPLWAYFLNKHSIDPLNLKKLKTSKDNNGYWPFKETGRMGFNGHTYN
jgi:hypothetical protein